jgi:SnoaL-like domain
MKLDHLQRVADELEILQILAKLAQAIDDRDEVRYRACLADEVMGPAPSENPSRWPAVTSQEYARRSVESVSDMEWTHHKLCNPIVDLMGDSASVGGRRGGGHGGARS